MTRSPASGASSPFESSPAAGGGAQRAAISRDRRRETRDLAVARRDEVRAVVRALDCHAADVARRARPDLGRSTGTLAYPRSSSRRSFARGRAWSSAPRPARAAAVRIPDDRRTGDLGDATRLHEEVAVVRRREHRGRAASGDGSPDGVDRGRGQRRVRPSAPVLLPWTSTSPTKTRSGISSSMRSITGRTGPRSTTTVTVPSAVRARRAGTAWLGTAARASARSPRDLFAACVEDAQVREVDPRVTVHPSVRLEPHRSVPAGR